MSDYVAATGNNKVINTEPHHRLTELGLDKLCLMRIHGLKVGLGTKIKVIQAVEKGNGECDCTANGDSHHYGCHSRNVVVQFPNEEVMSLDIDDIRTETAREKNVLSCLAFKEKLIAFENSPEPENWGD